MRGLQRYGEAMTGDNLTQAVNNDFFVPTEDYTEKETGAEQTPVVLPVDYIINGKHKSHNIP